MPDVASARESVMVLESHPPLSSGGAIFEAKDLMTGATTGPKEDTAHPA